MMTLSPNAQEFIPIAYTVPSVQTYVIDPSTGATSPVIISHIPFGYASSPYYAPNQIMVPGHVYYSYPSSVQSQTGPAPIPQTHSVSQEPYIADKNMYQKVFNNVNLIKQTIECHYNFQNRTPSLTPNNRMVMKKSNRKYSDKIYEQKVEFKLNDNDFPQLTTSLDKKQSNSNDLKEASSNEKSNDSTPKSNLHSLNAEFSNMVTALQLGQNYDPQSNCYNITNERIYGKYNRLMVPQMVSSLDSNFFYKRNIERDKPKKKKSTLKKIILREREEKKKQQEQNLDEDYNSTSDLNHLFNENKEETDENQEDQQIDLLSPISQTSSLSYNPNPSALANLNSEHFLTLDKLEERVKQKIHSNRYREYCHQIINKDIDETCTLLLNEIVKYQDRLYQKNPIKAKIKRKYVMGIREVTKHLKLFRVKCVILAPNCEKIESKGGLDDAINLIIRTSMEQNIPFLFALGRKELGKAVNKLVPVSVIGIFDYSGAEPYFERLVKLANNAKLAYQQMVEEFEKEECENLINNQSNFVNAINTSLEPLSTDSDPLTSSQSFPKIPSHMAHSRTPSNGSNISIEPFYHMNYHYSHSRSASGTFNYGHTTLVGGHSRSNSGGGIGAGGINLDLLVNSKSWTHSRTPSNCSNISFISRLSEPISELDNNFALNSTQAAVNFYNEQVKQEMKDEADEADKSADCNPLSESLANLHLGCINETDAGNDADTEDTDKLEN